MAIPPVRVRDQKFGSQRRAAQPPLAREWPLKGWGYYSVYVVGWVETPLVRPRASPRSIHGVTQANRKETKNPVALRSCSPPNPPPCCLQMSQPRPLGLGVSRTHVDCFQRALMALSKARHGHCLEQVICVACETVDLHLLK